MKEKIYDIIKDIIKDINKTEVEEYTIISLIFDDSLELFEFIALLERRLNIEIPDSDISKIQKMTINELIEYLKRGT